MIQYQVKASIGMDTRMAATNTGVVEGGIGMP